MCQSVRGPLINWSGKQWNDAVDFMQRPDGSKFSSGEEIEFLFQKLLDEGNEVIPLGECDNFDPKTGCRGHPIP